MNRYKHKVRNVFVTVWIMLVVNSGELLAQCAMCKASIESNVNEDGIGFASKLNTGILYLFIMPYLLAMIIGYFWLRKSREHRRQAEDAAYRKQKITNL